MKLDALTRLLGKKSTRPDLEQTTAALTEVEAELDSVRGALAEAEAAYDASVVDAVASGDDATLDRLREAVDGVRRRLELLNATRDAVVRRHDAAVEAEEARALATRWQRAREAADARREALVRLERALSDAGAAISDANAALARTVDLLPARPHGLPDGWPAHELAILVTAQLCVETGGAIRSSFPLSPFELAKLPGMVARHDVGASQLFASVPTSTEAAV